MNRSLSWFAVVLSVALLIGMVVVQFLRTFPLEEAQRLFQLGLVKQEDVAILSNALRGTWAQAIGGLVLLGTLIVGLKNMSIAHWNARLAERGQITERFTRAIEQLGNGTITVRLGGVYSLEKMAQDSREDETTIVEILAAFVREQTKPQSGNGRGERVTVDVQAAISVLGRIGRGLGIDLSGTDLQGVSFVNGDFRNARFFRSKLRGAAFTGAKLCHADFTQACVKDGHFDKSDLTYARFDQADISRARFTESILNDVTLVDANLEGAELTLAACVRAKFERANLKMVRAVRANFVRARIIEADLSGANFGGANLRSAIVGTAVVENTDFESADLEDAELVDTDFSLARNLTFEQVKAAVIGGDSVFSEPIQALINRDRSSDGPSQRS